MADAKLLQMIRHTTGKTQEALMAILSFRRGEVSEQSMRSMVYKYTKQLLNIIPKYFGGTSTDADTTKVLGQLIYGR